jgi:signal transduction histidine kinase/ActR/RegA family two-component response regulator
MVDTNKPAKTPSPRVMKQNPSGKVHAVKRSIRDSEQVAAPETSFRLEEQAEDVGAPENQGLTVGDRTTAVKNREGAVAAREETATLREEAAGVREEAAGLREETSTLREEREGAVSAREETATLREDAAGVREEAAGLREETSTRREEQEGAMAAREETATLREEAAGVREEAAGLREETSTRREEREGAMAAREETATLREDAAGVREEAAGLREETSTLREEALRAREETAQARSELEQLVAQMREVNERLVVATVRAQTMTEDAEQANHLKDEFLATVSHELRTPLNAIQGWARMLGSKQLPPDRATYAIGTIERNVAALAHLVEDLLDVSRIVAGTLHLASQPVDLVAVMQAALDVVRPLAVTKNVQLAFSPNLPAIATVSGDAGRLQQVIWNLLANAIKFTPEGGRVDVVIERSNNHMEVRVVDTGEGISPDFLPHMFERFRQADGATTRRHTGLGLGLAIVRQLVELHGGTVHAASQGVGRGATFTVRLPISAGEAHVDQAAALGERRIAASTASPMPRVPRLDGLRIVVVDDSADGRALTSLILTQAGASVTAVASVREALQMLDVEPPDALVSDIGLPDEDGYGLIRQIRLYEAEHGGFLPAVALTGHARAEDRARILAAGFQAYVPKPVDPVELTAAIATITHHLRDSEP